VATGGDFGFFIQNCGLLIQNCGQQCSSDRVQSESLIHSHKINYLLLSNPLFLFRFKDDDGEQMDIDNGKDIGKEKDNFSDTSLLEFETNSFVEPNDEMFEYSSTGEKYI